MASLVHDPRAAATLILIDEVSGVLDENTIWRFVQAELIEAGARGFSPLETLAHVAAYRKELLDEIAALRTEHQIPMLDGPAPAPANEAAP